MRKLILGLALTLDGYIEGPNAEYDWCFTDQDYGLNDFLKRVDAIFIGRKSYEMTQLNADGKDAEIVPCTAGMKEYVFSKTLKSVKKGAHLISDNAVDEAGKIKALPGKDIWLFGGAELNDALMKAGLVDELWMSVHPILLGKGKVLFQSFEDRINLTLLESKTYESGLVSLRYSIDKK